MKPRLGLSASLLCICSLLAPRALAQTPLDRLREEGRKLTEIQCSPTTAAVVREANGRLLNRRREAIALLLEQQLAELKDYAGRTGITLTAEDQKDLAAATAPIQAELDSARTPIAAICGQSVAQSPTATAADPPAKAEVSPATPPPAQQPVAAPPPAAPAPATPAQSRPTKTSSADQVGNSGKGDSTDGTEPDSGQQTKTTPPASLSLTSTPPGAGGGNAVSWHSMYTRGVAGIDVSGASSLPTQQKIFVEFNLTAPLGILSAGKRTRIAKLHACLDSLSIAMRQFGETSSGEGEATQKKVSLGDSKKTCKDATNNLDINEDRVQLSLLPSTPDSVTKDQMDSLLTDARRALYAEEDPTRHRLWVWMNPRISSLPQQATDLLTNVNSSTTTFNTLAKSSFNQVVQGFELLGGLEFLLNHPGNAWRFGNSGLALALVGGAGFTTPFPANLANTQQFTVSNTLTAKQIATVFGPQAPPICIPGQMSTMANPCTALCPPMTSPTATSPCVNVVAFVPPDRTRFYAQYFVGLRLKTFFYRTHSATSELGDLCKDRQVAEICPLFPGIFEIGVGQNAAVSGGRLHGYVLRSEAFYPLPFATSFHLFYTTWVHLGGKNFTTTPVILDNVSPPLTSLNVPGVVILPHEVPDRDYYRLGVGLDLINLYHKIREQGQDKAVHDQQDAKKQQQLDDQVKQNQDQKKMINALTKRPGS